jgi:acyl-CoA reductase-like NAD-dependent aldehyde dehydrogenase
VSTIEVDNPATGEIACRFEQDSSESLEAALARAVVAGREWAAMPVAARVAVCERATAVMERDSESLAVDISSQMGKPLSQARSEVATSCVRARYMQSVAERCLADKPLEGPDGFELFVERLPLGVVLNVPAWNYPLLTAVNALVPALLAGNAVLLRHSSRTPLCGGHFERAFLEAGLPAGALAAVHADHDATARLVADPRVDYIAFTGSTRGGRELSKAAAGRFVDLGLELGGNDAAWVRADAELPSTAESLAEGAFYNAGQSCCGVERVFAQDDVYDELLDLLVARSADWKPGDPMDEATSMGPMAQASSIALLEQHVADAVERGARLLAGGKPAQLDGRGRYFEATVLADVPADAQVMKEESFGPLLAVARVADDESAIAAVNDSRYGLTASVWSRDLDRSRAIGRSLEVGTVFLNRCDFLDPALPWSGWKDSGVGLTLSELGFDRLTRTRGFHLRLP